jgi:hypothetical protein
MFPPSGTPQIVAPGVAGPVTKEHPLPPVKLQPEKFPVSKPGFVTRFAVAVSGATPIKRPTRPFVIIERKVNIFNETLKREIRRNHRSIQRL